MDNCIFCKIIKGEIQSKKLYEDENFIIINDITPKAKCHHLVIPKKHYAHLSETTPQDAQALGEMLAKIPHLTLETKNGYRLIINQGTDGGQEIAHLHVHILCGENLESRFL